MTMKGFLKLTVFLSIVFALCFAMGICVQALDSGTCGENLTWTLDDNGTLTISGSGAMENYAYYNDSEAPWYSLRRSVLTVTISEGVTSIGNSAFRGCSSLTSITIPGSVTTIGDSAFYNCSSLTSVTIPDSVTSIGDFTFVDCKSLSSVYIEDLSAWCNIQFEGVASNPLWNAGNLYLNKKQVTDLKIPDDVTSIENYAFSYCSSLTSITIPDSVTSIGNEAFLSCSSLASVTIPDSVTSIGKAAFEDCGSLISVTIPSSVTIIGNKAFSDCSRLSSVTISGGITTIESSTFSYCSSLASITIPDSVTSIGMSAFSGCISLSSVTIPGSVTSIGGDAFYKCSSLSNVYIEDLSAWCNIFFGDLNANPLSVNSSGASLYLNNSLVEELIIPKDVININANTFYNCDSIKSVEFHDKVKYIFGSAFYDCGNLTDVYFGKGLSSIVTNAFYGCDNVENVYYAGSEKEWAGVVIGGGNDCISNANVTFGTVNVRIYTFVTNGGSEVSDIEGEITEAPVTMREGYDFLGWYTNEGCNGDEVTFPYSGAETVLYAKWWKTGEEIRGIEYEITSLSVKDNVEYEPLDKIPAASFIAEVTVKNLSSEKTDTIIIAAYDENDALLGIYYMYATMDIGESVTFGTSVLNNGNVKKVKAFVRPDLKRLTPLAEAKEF